MRAVTIHRHPNGPRVYVAGQRLHHGATGCALALAGVAVRRRAILALALALVAHDRHDWAIWFKRERMRTTTEIGSVETTVAIPNHLV